MSDALLVLQQALHDTWSDLWTVLVCNLVWLLSVLLIIPGPPATLALFYYANRVAHGEVADLSDFLAAFRRYWRVAWRWGLLNLLIFALLLGDFYLTGDRSSSNTSRIIQGFYLAVLGGWLLVQLFALPFLIEQESASLRFAFRNSAVMVGRNIGFSTTLGVLLTVILLAGILLFMLSFAVGGFFVAAAGNHAVINRLETYRVSQK